MNNVLNSNAVSDVPKLDEWAFTSGKNREITWIYHLNKFWEEKARSF
jgi:hypothetical protein